MNMNKPARISEEECYELFKKFNTPAHVIRHCRAVSDTAVRIAEALNEQGCDFDVELIRGAALIHDLRRVEPNHDLRAQAVLESLGYADEGRMVGVHMRHIFPHLSEAGEVDILCLGDRLVREDAYAGLDSRIEYLLERRGTTEDKRESILKIKEQMRSFMDEVEEVLGTTIDSLFTE